MHKEIELKEMIEMQKKGAILIDVRSLQEYREGHLLNSILIPEYEIRNQIQKKNLEKDTKIIVYCSTGHRSKEAKKILENLGYEEVYNLSNGIENYCDFEQFMVK